MHGWLHGRQKLGVLPRAQRRFLLQIDGEQRLNHRDRSCKTFGWIGLECTCYAPEIGWFVENMASKLVKMWSENGRMNHGKRRWASLAAIISLRLLIARQRRLQETSGWPHALQNPPNVHLHATDPPTVRPLWLFIYCRLPKCTGAWWRADALMDANYFESPAPSPCHPVMGNVIGLFANRAKRGIVLVETFSISQKGLNPPLKALSCSGYICSSWNSSKSPNDLSMGKGLTHVLGDLPN